MLTSSINHYHWTCGCRLDSTSRRTYEILWWSHVEVISSDPERKYKTPDEQYLRFNDEVTWCYMSLSSGTNSKWQRVMGRCALVFRLLHILREVTNTPDFPPYTEGRTVNINQFYSLNINSKFEYSWHISYITLM